MPLMRSLASGDNELRFFTVTTTPTKLNGEAIERTKAWRTTRIEMHVMALGQQKRVHSKRKSKMQSRQRSYPYCIIIPTTSHRPTLVSSHPSYAPLVRPTLLVSRYLVDNIGCDIGWRSKRRKGKQRTIEHGADASPGIADSSACNSQDRFRIHSYGNLVRHLGPETAYSTLLFGTERLQGVKLAFTFSSSVTSPCIAASLLPVLPLIRIRFPQGNKADVIRTHGLPTLRRHQIVWDVLEVGLMPDHGTMLAVVSQMSQVVGVLLEMFPQFLALDQFLLDFSRASLVHCRSRDRTQRVVHSIPERIDLRHVEMVRFHLVALLGLAGHDLLEHLFILPGRRDASGLVLAVKVLRDHERQSHACFAGSCCPPDTVSVGFGCPGQVEVDDACHVLKIDASGYTVILLFVCQLCLLCGA